VRRGLDERRGRFDQRGRRVRVGRRRDCRCRLDLLPLLGEAELAGVEGRLLDLRRRQRAQVVGGDRKSVV